MVLKRADCRDSNYCHFVTSSWEKAYVIQRQELLLPTSDCISSHCDARTSQPSSNCFPRQWFWSVQTAVTATIAILQHLLERKLLSFKDRNFCCQLLIALTLAVMPGYRSPPLTAFQGYHLAACWLPWQHNLPQLHLEATAAARNGFASYRISGLCLCLLGTIWAGASGASGRKHAQVVLVPASASSMRSISRSRSACGVAVSLRSSSCRQSPRVMLLLWCHLLAVRLHAVLLRRKYFFVLSTTTATVSVPDRFRTAQAYFAPKFEITCVHAWIPTETANMFQIQQKSNDITKN